ncbi:MAG: hypothetical protein IKM17_02580, partial [Lentisphaeria bacterium]|nr:hypothetical protein [Lentisphaeria bacterium]
PRANSLVPESVDLPHLSAKLHEIENIAGMPPSACVGDQHHGERPDRPYKIERSRPHGRYPVPAERFFHHQGISHATLEFESASFPCPET